MTVTAPAKVFADRIGRIEVSATMAVAAEAAKLRAQGANLVDFGAGEPHFPTPRHIKDAAIAAIEANFTRYTVVPGIPDVRKAIVERHACDFGSDYVDRRGHLHHRRQAGAVQRHPGAGRPRRRGHPARSLLGQLQRHHPVRRRQGGLSRDQRGGELPHHGGRHRARHYAAHQGHHPQLAVESGRLGGLRRGPGAHCPPGPRARHFSASGRVLRVPELCRQARLRRLVHLGQGAHRHSRLALEDLLHDRLARGLCAGAKARRRQPEQAAVAVHVERHQLCAEGGHRGAHRLAGVRGRVPRRVHRPARLHAGRA